MREREMTTTGKTTDFTARTTSTVFRPRERVAEDVRRWQADHLEGRRARPVPRDESGYQMSWDAAATYFGSDFLEGRCPVLRRG